MDNRYALVNAAGETVNVILWDGKTPYTPPEGLEVVPEGKAGAYAPVGDPSAHAPSPDSFSRLTDDERAAVIEALVSMGAITAERRDELVKP
jgi:hypothetical protein